MPAIVWKVRQVAEARGIDTPMKLARHVNISRNTAKSIWYGAPERVDFPTLIKLCQGLNVQIGDLLEFAPNKNKAARLVAV